LRELFDAYAHCADRRDTEGQKALFTDEILLLNLLESPLSRGLHFESSGQK
jgi:hypothetical protein